MNGVRVSRGARYAAWRACRACAPCRGRRGWRDFRWRQRKAATIATMISTTAPTMATVFAAGPNPRICNSSAIRENAGEKMFVIMTPYLPVSPSRPKNARLAFRCSGTPCRPFGARRVFKVVSAVLAEGSRACPRTRPVDRGRRVGSVCICKPYSLLHHFSFRPSFAPGVRSKLRSNVAPSAWNSATSEIHRSLPILEPPTVPYRFSHHADNPRTATLQNHTARTTHPPSPDTAIHHSVTFNIPLCTSCTLGAIGWPIGG